MSEIIMLTPLAAIASFAIIAIILDPLSGQNRRIMFAYSMAALIIVTGLSAYTLWLTLINQTLTVSQSLTKGMVLFGNFSAFLDILFCIAGILTLLASKQYLVKSNSEYKEFYSLLLFAVSGMMLIGHSANLLILFIGIEVMSVSFYVMSGFFRTNVRSVEAALKYFLLGAFATGFLVYGIAMLYGSTGSFNLSVIQWSIITSNFNPFYLTIGFGLVLIGLGFKVAAFPFHQWAPDVYEGAPTVVTGFMSTAGKAAALVGFIIVAHALIPVEAFGEQIRNFSQNAKLVIALISAATMLFGNIVALVQKNIKRMLAYSSIAHAGYLLIGIVANNQRGWGGILFYLSAYLFMQIGAFVVVSVLEKEQEGNLQLDDYSGLRKSHPVLAAMMALFMLSLAGIPPMAGFFGKYYLFLAAIEAGYTWLTIIAVISSIISVYFYIGLIVYMYFKDETESQTLTNSQSLTNAGLSGVTLVISTVFILLLGIFPSYLIDLAMRLF